MTTIIITMPRRNPTDDLWQNWDEMILAIVAVAENTKSVMA